MQSTDRKIGGFCIDGCIGIYASGPKIAVQYVHWFSLASWISFGSLTSSFLCVVIRLPLLLHCNFSLDEELKRLPHFLALQDEVTHNLTLTLNWNAVITLTFVKWYPGSYTHWTRYTLEHISYLHSVQVSYCPV